MTAATQITPSASARRLFGRMVARADDTLHLGLPETLDLGCVLKREGEDPSARAQITELLSQEWIEPASDGGWTLYEGTLEASVKLDG